MSKSGLDYFPLCCQQDDKLNLIEAEFGIKGSAVVFKLFQRIYGEQGYYCEWNNEVDLLFSSRVCGLAVGDKFVSEVVNAALKRNLFSKEIYTKYHVLTSKGIQERYFIAVKRRKCVEIFKEYLLVSADQIPNNVSIISKNADIIAENDSINGQTKVKKSKVNESKGNKKEIKEKVQSVRYAENDKLDKTICDYIEYRNKIKSPMTEHAIELMIKKLDTLADNDDDRIGILEQSMINCWKDIFPLNKQKSRKTESPPPVKPTRFTNFKEHDWDFDELNRIKQAELMEKLKGMNCDV